jgi:membrane-bound lytic murein transglycosylase A
MKHLHIALLSAFLFLSLQACKTAATQPDYGRALPDGAPALLPLGPDDRCPDFAPQWHQRDEILPALDQSIAWARKSSSKQFFPKEGITIERLQQSLERFRAALVGSPSAEEFSRRIQSEFVVMKSAGWDGRGGGVLYTAYCTPILDGRLERDATYRYPLYAQPEDLVKEPDGAIRGRRTPSGSIEPYPTRRAIEASGLLENQRLELAWLKDPLDAYIAHVNGSAFIRLPDGTLHKLGYAGKNGQPYTSLGQELVKDKQLEKDRVSLRAIREWARAHPGEVQEYLNRNDSFVFFTPIDGDPRGSLNVPVTAERSLATDKRLFPRGAIVYVEGKAGSGIASGAHLDHFMLDQDTGGAIRTAGRADVYMGSGEAAEAVSGSTRVEGQLYYLFVRDDLPKP